MKYLILSLGLVLGLATGGIAYAGGGHGGGDTIAEGGDGGAGVGIGIGVGIGAAQAQLQVNSLAIGGASATECSWAAGPVAGPTRLCNLIKKAQIVDWCLGQSGNARIACVTGLKKDRTMREMFIAAGALVVK